MSEFLGSFEPFAEMIIVFGIVFWVISRGKVHTQTQQRVKERVNVVLLQFFGVVTAFIIALYFLGRA